MITRKRLTLNHDLMPPPPFRAIERREQEMQIRRQRLHDGDLFRRGADDGGHGARGRLVGVQPGRQRGVGEGLEVALHALRGPRGEELGEARGDAAGLEAEGVAAEVDAGGGGVR